MALRIVGPEEMRAPRPRRMTVPSGRAGEHHEPVHLAHDVAANLTRAASAEGIPASLALAVLLEAELAVHAVIEAGGTPARLGSHKDRSASLSAAQSDYLEFIAKRQASQAPAQQPTTSSAELVVVPVRLLPFCDESLLRVAVHRDLGQALRWEEHAARSGRTLTEWTLRQALMTASAARCR